MLSKVGKLLSRNKVGQGQAHKPLVKPQALSASDHASKVFEEMEETRMDKMLRAFDKIPAPLRS